MTEAGADVMYRSVPGAEHGFEGYPDVAGLVTETIEFLRMRLITEAEPGRPSP